MKKAIVELVACAAAVAAWASSPCCVGYDEWLRDWSENVRTNMALETCASFRDAKLRPFLMAQMDPERKATKDEGEFLNEVVDKIWGGGGLKSVGDKKRLNAILAKTAGREFAAYVLACTTKGSDRGVSVVEWIRSGDFHGEDMRAVFWTIRNDKLFGNGDILAGLESAGVDEWLTLLWRISLERSAAWKARGGGYADTVSENGWEGYSEHGEACRAAFERAMELHSYPEAAYLFSSFGPFSDDVFRTTTEAQLDFNRFYEKHLWYNCYPRWCGSFKKMKAFADRCYETKRHDTMVPYQYAESLLRMVKDMGVPLEDYFRDHPEELDKIIEVCEPQIKSANAFSNVRQCAGVFATLAYSLRGKWETAVATWRSFNHSTLPKSIWDIFKSEEISRRWMVWNAISGKNGSEVLKLHKLYLAGDFAGFLAALDVLNGKGVEFTNDERVYIGEIGTAVRMKLDFPAGKPVTASFPKDKTCWLTFGGAWRLDGSCAYFGGKYKGGNPLEWNVTVPGNFRMECEIAPEGKRDEWQFEFLQKPGDPSIEKHGTYPHLWLDFKKGSCDVSFAEWKYIHNFKSAKKTTVPYSGGAVRLVVVYDSGNVKVFLGYGKEPAFESEEFTSFLKMVADGHLKFNGTGARINSLKVMRPDAVK